MGAALAEAGAVLARRQAEAAGKGAAQRGRAAEAGEAGDLVERARARLEQPARAFEAHALDESRGRQPDFGAKGAREMAHAQAGAAGHGWHVERRFGMLEDERLQIAQRRSLRRLRRQL